MPDLTYITDKLFTRFIPQTEAGENAWREMGDNTAVLNIHAKNVIAQLRAAGYEVAKHRKGASKLSASDYELLAQLGE